VANPKNHVETISGDRHLLSRKFFFWFNVNQNLLHLRHVFQNSVLHLMSYAMPFPYGQGAMNDYVQVCIKAESILRTWHLSKPKTPSTQPAIRRISLSMVGSGARSASSRTAGRIWCAAL
jgi:hypothetical protein